MTYPAKSAHRTAAMVTARAATTMTMSVVVLR